MPPRGEADEIMAMSAKDALDLQIRTRVGAPGDVRRFLLWSAWHAIKTSPGPQSNKERVGAFRALCAQTGPVEVVLGR